MKNYGALFLALVIRTIGRFFGFFPVNRNKNSHKIHFDKIIQKYDFDFQKMLMG